MAMKPETAIKKLFKLATKTNIMGISPMNNGWGLTNGHFLLALPDNLPVEVIGYLPKDEEDKGFTIKNGNRNSPGIDLSYIMNKACMDADVLGTDILSDPPDSDTARALLPKNGEPIWINDTYLSLLLAVYPWATLKSSGSRRDPLVGVIAGEIVFMIMPMLVEGRHIIDIYQAMTQDQNEDTEDQEN